MIPKSKHVITQYLEIFSPSQVVRDLLGMLTTIDLDDKLGLQAEEIDDVGSKDLLTSKLDAVESSTAQSTPQAPLRLGRILPQRPGQTVHRSFYPLTSTLSRRERELTRLSCNHCQTVSPLTHEFCGRALWLFDRIYGYSVNALSRRERAGVRGSQPRQREYSPTPRQGLRALHDSKIEARDNPIP